MMTKENVAIEVTVHPSTVEERVRDAAEEGNIEALYGLIHEKANFLKDIDQMEFVHTIDYAPTPASPMYISTL